MAHKFTPEERAKSRETRAANRAAAHARPHPNGAGSDAAAKAIADEQLRTARKATVEEVSPPDEPGWREYAEPADPQFKGKARAVTTQISWMLRGVFNVLAMGLGSHWRLSTNEERDLTQAVYAAILAQPKHRQSRLIGSLMSWTPNLFLAATLVTILAPRILQTQMILRGRRAAPGPGRVPPVPRQAAPPPASPTAPLDGATSAPPPSDIMDAINGDEAAA